MLLGTQSALGPQQIPIHTDFPPIHCPVLAVKNPLQVQGQPPVLLLLLELLLHVPNLWRQAHLPCHVPQSFDGAVVLQVLCFAAPLAAPPQQRWLLPDDFLHGVAGAVLYVDQLAVVQVFQLLLPRCFDGDSERAVVRQR